MDKPVLVIMAAGMGSRYGGLKQMDPVDNEGHFIIDFSIYDAIKAGFEKIIFIIKKENEKDFKDGAGRRVSGHVQVEYVFQDIDNIPKGYRVPPGRIKPWGTGHAVLCCMGRLDGPFAVINADDFYGRHAFSAIYNYLADAMDDDYYRYAMVGYTLENTLTENGSVARGICTTDSDNYLVHIKERTHIEKKGEYAAYTEDQGKTWVRIPERSIVSMNMWGFTNSILRELEEKFKTFLNDSLKTDPLKAEFYLPDAVGSLLRENRAKVLVLKSPDRWYGVTYKEDKKMVVSAVAKMKEEGLYPDKLWSGV